MIAAWCFVHRPGVRLPLTLAVRLPLGIPTTCHNPLRNVQQSAQQSVFCWCETLETIKDVVLTTIATVREIGDQGETTGSNLEAQIWGTLQSTCWRDAQENEGVYREGHQCQRADRVAAVSSESVDLEAGFRAEPPTAAIDKLSGRRGTRGDHCTGALAQPTHT